MLTGAIASKVIVTVAAANAAATFIDSGWAIPLNTALLIVLALVSARNTRKIDETKDHVLETKANTTHAASAAAAAAASALTAARIAKEVGGTLRSVEPPATSPPLPATETGPIVNG